MKKSGCKILMEACKIESFLSFFESFFCCFSFCYLIFVFRDTFKTTL